MRYVDELLGEVVPRERLLGDGQKGRSVDDAGIGRDDRDDLLTPSLGRSSDDCVIFDIRVISDGGLTPSEVEELM